MSWISVLKPTSSTYTYSNFEGTQSYDDTEITYDQATVYYDSTAPSVFTMVGKPTSSLWSVVSKPTG